MDTDAEYRKMRAQLDELDRRLAQWQSATQPIVPPRPHVDHARCDASLNYYQRPGTLPEAASFCMPRASAAETRSLHDFMIERSYDMTNKAERREYGRRIRGE